MVKGGLQKIQVSRVKILGATKVKRKIAPNTGDFIIGKLHKKLVQQVGSYPAAEIGKY